MHMFLASANFMLTIAVGVAAFVLAAIHAPTELKQLIDAANVGLNQVLTAYVDDRYSVLIGFVFDGKNVVLMGFIIATRIVFALIWALFFPAPQRMNAMPAGDDAAPARDSSAFWGWGKKGP
ncbi:MAG: hypothetical protein NW215_10125 [Hyphomicrobiales bacterium]|nr:hypothetical protein [Hyphomicrobiales bacterium]